MKLLGLYTLDNDPREELIDKVPVLLNGVALLEDVKSQGAGLLGFLAYIEGPSPS